MKKVLYIAYHFPPIAGGGVFRSLNFVKHLPSFGWQPTVLTVNTRVSWAYDDKLLDKIPSSIKIIRAGQLEWFYLHVFFSKLGMPGVYEHIKNKYLIPDTKIGWYKRALHKAKLELSNKKYDLIFSTSPTVVSHMIAMKLSKQFTIPWICDFRDFWISHKNYAYHGYPRAKKEAELEKIIMEQSSKIIVVSNGMKEVFYQRYPEINPGKIQVVTNGFDNDIDLEPARTENFKITYTGSFYGEYNPEIFIEAVQQIVTENNDFADKVILQFIGKIEEKIQNSILQKIPEHVRFLPYQNPSKLLRYIQSTDLLLLFLPKDNHYKAYLPKKMFDYMNYLKPILAIVPKGDCYSVLKKSGVGLFPSEYSITGLKTELVNIFNQWQSSSIKVNPNLDYIQQFHYTNLTKRLTEIFES